MRTLRGWIIASWILLPGVMAGGTLLLRRVALDDPTAFQVTWLRAFHAHGGVLFVLSLVYFLFLSQTTLSTSVNTCPLVPCSAASVASREGSSSRRSWDNRILPRSELPSRSVAPPSLLPRSSFWSMS